MQLVPNRVPGLGTLADVDLTEQGFKLHALMITQSATLGSLSLPLWRGRARAGLLQLVSARWCASGLAVPVR